MKAELEVLKTEQIGLSVLDELYNRIEKLESLTYQILSNLNISGVDLSNDITKNTKETNGPTSEQ